ncbi:MAG TPA: MFS transporter [Burkholderiales bacterium]|nr:MFS transporter [Burkholderiales bacterium]
MTAGVGVVAKLGAAQTLAWASSYYLPAVLANAMAAELGLSTAWVFVAFSLGLLVSGFCGPLSGRLIDAQGGHRVLPASNVLFAVSLAALGMASGPASLVLSWLLMGVAMSCGLYEAAFSTLARIYGSEARRAITGITLIAGFASTIGWPLTAWLEVSYGWRTACFVWAATHLALCLPLNLSLPRGRHAPAASAAASRSAPAKARQRWMMAALAFVFAGTWFGSTSMAAHLPRVLQEAGASLPAAIAAAALVGPAQVAARVLEFWLMRRVAPVTSAQVATLAHPAGVGLLLAAGAPAAPFFTVAHGAGNGVMTIANGTLPLHFFGPGGYGLRQGVLMMPARFLQAGAPFAFDLLLASFGTAALCVTAAFGLASFVVLGLLRGHIKPGT